MEVIQSFTIDHTHLKPGIYVSRIDKGFTTFDLRITEPNKEPAVAPAAMHSLEHLMATWFRNSPAKDDVVYVGPMGCLTGMYGPRCLPRPPRPAATACCTTCPCASGKAHATSTGCSTTSTASTPNCKSSSTTARCLPTPDPHSTPSHRRLDYPGVTQPLVLFVDGKWAQRYAAICHHTSQATYCHSRHPHPTGNRKLARLLRTHFLLPLFQTCHRHDSKAIPKSKPKGEEFLIEHTLINHKTWFYNPLIQALLTSKCVTHFQSRSLMILCFIVTLQPKQTKSY